MIELEQDQKETNFKQAKLLFQCGAWISAMDDAGGRKSDEMERDAIFQTLERFSHEPDYRRLQQIFSVALSSRSGWVGWSRDMSNFTRDLKTELPNMPLELRQCCYDIAYSVAIRYQERGFLSTFITGIKVSLKDFLSPETRNTEFSHYIKISAAEKNALNELAEILEMPQRIIE